MNHSLGKTVTSAWGFALALSLALASCATTGAASAGTARLDAAAYLAAREWALIQLDGCTLAAEDRPTLGFRPGTAGNPAAGSAATDGAAKAATGEIFGYTGLNRYFGEYRLEGNTLSLAMRGMTKMAGPPEVMELELKVAAYLDGRPLAFDLDGQTLNLYQGDRLVMIFAAVAATGAK
ncbi:MAG: META domain-containing protein [Spirochaetaceae bacterium]|nr:META domain-containing protein [Spirochaetaceae bacterium]